MHIYHVVGAFVFWYVYFTLEYSFNDGGAGRNPYFMIFQLFWQDILWSIPGGLKRKTAFIKERFEPEDVCIAGSKRNWEGRDVARDNLYEDCAKDVLPGWFGFWVRTIVVLVVGAFLGEVVVVYWKLVLIFCVAYALFKLFNALHKKPRHS